MFAYKQTNSKSMKNFKNFKPVEFRQYQCQNCGRITNIPDSAMQCRVTKGKCVLKGI